jgi:endonuclease/exonuclease/phosphatase family metal-dependent hydrolase
MDEMRLLMLMLMVTPALAAQDSASSDVPFKVMSFNIRYGTANDGPNHWQHREALVIQVLRDHQPDIVGVQEALDFQIHTLCNTLPQYTKIGVGRDDGKTAGEYSAILYRPERFRITTSGTFWLSDTPEMPGSITWGNACTRICTWAYLQDRKTGRIIAVYNTHWDHRSQPSRVKSAALMIRWMQQSPAAEGILLMGDLNADEENPATRLLQQVSLTLRTDDEKKTSTEKLVDTFRVLHPRAGDVGTFNGFKGTRSGGKIDYVFATENLKVIEARILHDHSEGRYPSDHFPVSATLGF